MFSIRTRNRLKPYLIGALVIICCATSAEIGWRLKAFQVAVEQQIQLAYQAGELYGYMACKR